ncbi:MAG: hypothetical protein FWC38_05985 [Proteobacteria bacterium]|nr:hypothetical protein [Pseudomonadota bacterium]
MSSRQPTATALSQYNALVAAINNATINAGRLRRMWWTTPGTFTFIAPVEDLIIYASGAGGGHARNGLQDSFGGGAASIIALPMRATVGQPITVVVGAGGTNNLSAASSNSVFAGHGGDTSLLGVTAQGGRGGVAPPSGSSSSHASPGTHHRNLRLSQWYKDGESGAVASTPGVSALAGINGDEAIGRGATSNTAYITAGNGIAGIEWIGAAS